MPKKPKKDIFDQIWTKVNSKNYKGPFKIDVEEKPKSKDKWDVFDWDSLDVKVKSYFDLKLALKPFEINSTSQIRKDLISGFETIKRHQEFLKEQRLGDADFGGYFPALINGNIDDMKGNVDIIIKKRLDGKRKGLKVVWDNVEGKKYEFDPYTGELKCQMLI